MKIKIIIAGVLASASIAGAADGAVWVEPLWAGSRVTSPVTMLFSALEPAV